MRTHVDWLTFTMQMRLPRGTQAESEAEIYAERINTAFTDMFGEELLSDVFGSGWERAERSRAPYTEAWVAEEIGARLFASPNLTHCCVEISGQGCERLIAQGRMVNVLQACSERVTRIDVACDVETAVAPLEFVEKTKGKRIKTTGYVTSKTGETVYVGSQKSERYARVYRYSEPHPRSHLLRIEHVFRRDHAKAVARNIVWHGLESVAKASGEAFGWAHGIWQPAEVSSVDLSVARAERGAGKTVYWLVNSVAPAFERLCKDGTIPDREAFLRAYFGLE